MNINFDVSDIDIIEFGIGQGKDEKVLYSLLPTDHTVKEALTKVVENTLAGNIRNTVAPSFFDPSEKYGNEEYVVLPLQHELATSLSEFHKAESLSTSTPQLPQLRRASCYFMRCTDKDERRLTALNRASHFKATLGKQGRMVALFSDTLRVIPDPVMQLNTGFDILIDSEFVHILHPASFRALGNVDEVIAQAIPKNVEAISQAAPYVDWSNIEEYAVSHSRAASLLASINSQGYAKNIDQNALELLCQKTGLALDTSRNQLVVPKEQILDFLEVIDRRRYEIGLVPNVPEQYKASSRTRVRRS